jgi:predicted Zn-dependent peptidase
MSVEITTLPNGLRVASENMPHLETTTVGVWVGVGARNESLEYHGVSHMLEHMAFKGTKTRNAKQIAEEIESVGGFINAYTSREQTAYYARILKGDLGLAVELLGDILQNSTFESHELERERGVIIQEIGQTADTPDEIVFDYQQAAAYPDQAIGRAILGTKETVNGFSGKTLQQYMARNYSAPNLVLAAAGAVDHEVLANLANQHFGGLSSGGADAPAAAVYKGGSHREQKELEQAHITLGIEGVALEDLAFYDSQVFVNVLGGGMSSRLFQEVRETRGLCYSVYSYASSYSDSGLVGVYAGTGPDELPELVSVMLDQFDAISKNATEDEISRAKAQMKAGLMMGLESSSARCEQIARHLLIFGRVVPTDELGENIDAVDAERVMKFSERLMKTENPTIAAVGPIEKLESNETIASRFG